VKGSVLTTSSGSDARRTGLRLGLLLGLVVLIQLVYLHQFPFPPHSSHDGFTLVPQLQRLVMGQIPDDARFGMFEGTWFPPVTAPEAETGWEAFLARLFGNVRSHTWVDAPHPLALAGGAAAVLPGWPLIPAFVMTGYFVLLLLSLYAIGRRLASARVGLLAATLAAGSPGLFGLSRYVETHLPMVAMATAVVAVIAHLDGLRRWRMCLLASVLTWSLTRSGEGAGEVVIAGLLIAGPGLWVLIRSGRGAKPWPWVLGLACLVLPFMLLSDLAFLQACMEKVTRAFADPTVQTDVVQSGGALAHPWAWRGAYLWLIATDYLSPVLALWLIPAAVGLWSLRKRQRVGVYLWLLVPLVALSFMQRKAAWYGTGLIPPLVLLMAIGLNALSRSWLIRGAALTALLQLVLYSALPQSAFSGIAATLRAPVPVSDSRLRRLDLLRPADTTATARLLEDTDAFIEWLDTHHPPDGTRRWVAAVAQGYGPDYVFRYRVMLRRPDVDVLNLTDPRARKLGYRGFSPDDFVAFVHLSDGLAPWPPEMADRAWFAHNLHCAPDDPLDRFLGGLMRRSLVSTDATVPVYGFAGPVGWTPLGAGRRWAGSSSDRSWSLCGP
jgi:hypothetical protein